jgi:hypothetical protein
MKPFIIVVGERRINLNNVVYYRPNGRGSVTFFYVDGKVEHLDGDVSEIDAYVLNSKS